MDLLRFITAGSVDDGKSTLIGRLLYDTDSIKVDQLKAIIKQSRNKKEGEIDLALFTDGLRAEREQGITIDVAYKYFNTTKRKFIIADAPGHIQYTRNMVTGASNADLIVILIDARHGVSEQTRRHSIIASLLRIPHVVVAINKMDMVNYSEDVFNSIIEDYSGMAKQLDIKDITYIPLNSLDGDNIVVPSQKMDWYDGPTLLHLLETIDILNDINQTDPRFPVQYVIRPQAEDLHDYRGYAGKVISGSYKKGDRVVILPEGTRSTIAAVEMDGKEVEEAIAPQSAVLRLTDDIDIARGDNIVTEGFEPRVETDFDITLCWMDSRPLIIGSRYLLQLHSRTVRCIVREIHYKLNVNTLEKQLNPDTIGLNDIASVRLKAAAPLVFDPYETLRANGGVILIDETGFSTVAGGMIK